MRAGRIIGSSAFFTKYEFKVVNDTPYCSLVLVFPPETKKLLLTDVIEAVAQRCVIQQVKGIKRCFPLAAEPGDEGKVSQERI